jgi:creatinine amidohydrolase/Fe(II)-dependent formamide hydrolase-like protein
VLTEIGRSVGRTGAPGNASAATAALGNASAATAALGAAILDHQAARLATLLEEVRRFDLHNWMRAAPLPHDKPADRD